MKNDADGFSPSAPNMRERLRPLWRRRTSSWIIGAIACASALAFITRKRTRSALPARSPASTREKRLHFLHQPRALDRYLRLPLAQPFRTAFDGFGKFGTALQVLQRHLAGRALVGALDHRDRGTALVGVFQLVAELLRPDIGLGAQTCLAQLARHGKALRRVVHGEHNRQRRQRRLAPLLHSRKQTADADGNAGSGHLLSGEPRHQVVIAAPARHGTEHDGFAGFVGDRELQLRLEHRASIIFQSANDAGVDLHSIFIVSVRCKRSPYGLQFLYSRNRVVPLRGRGEQFHHKRDLLFVEAGACGEIAGFILAPFAQQRPHACFSRRSYLSMARSTVPRCRSLTDADCSTASSKRRLFILTMYSPRLRPRASSASHIIIRSSASAAGEALPTVSASNCVNSR